MVEKVTRPTANSVDIVQKVLDERVRYRSFYNRIASDMISNIELYLGAKGDPSQLSPMLLRSYTANDIEAAARKQTLINLYSPPKGSWLYKLLDDMRTKNELVVCPCCGEEGRPRTLDHYLPKAVFPEFAITLANLTPMCDWCQGAKLEAYIQDGEKLYIHPYYDDVGQPLFCIKFIPPYCSPRIYIEIHSHLPLELRNLVMRHLSGINFLGRFCEIFSTKYITVLRKAIACQSPSSLYPLGVYLEIFLERAEGVAINSWDAVLYRSILNDTNLMLYLTGGELPEHI